MLGADIVLASVNSVTGDVSVTDTYVDWAAYPNTDSPMPFPATDDCQDWVALFGSEDATGTTVVLRRKLATGNAQDRDIVAGAQNRFVYAWGPDGGSDSVSYHGANRGSVLLNLASGATSVPLPAAAADSVDIYITNYTIPEQVWYGGGAVGSDVPWVGGGLRLFSPAFASVAPVHVP
jgi:hypothetical protein